MTDSGRIDAPVNPVVAGDGAEVAVAATVGGGGVGVGVLSGVVGGRTGRKESVWLLHAASRPVETHKIATPTARTLIPMPIERSAHRLGSAM
ncbi:MAG TPA: hypothetical protein VI434_04160 [Candidatus Dormibacteraeota bacterium]